jgi:hypothetical protein
MTGDGWLVTRKSGPTRRRSQEDKGRISSRAFRVEAFSISHANKNGARYRYYLRRKDMERLSLPVHRVPAGKIEKLVIDQLRKHSGTSWDTALPSRETVLQYIKKVRVYLDRIVIDFADIDEPVREMKGLRQGTCSAAD